MVFYINILATAVIVTVILWLLSEKSRYTLSNMGYICEFFALTFISGIVVREYIYLFRSGDYFFMDYNSTRALKVMVAALIADIVVMAVIMVVNLYLKKGNKDCFLRIKGMAVFPVVSFKYVSGILFAIYMIFAISDTLMPQFAYWNIEDNNINKYTHIHKPIRANRDSLDYPYVNPIEMGDGETDSYDRTVLVIGDSFIWGDGCGNYNQLWWMQLQRKLFAKGYDNIRVAAVGTNGASTQDQLGWIVNTTMIRDINPDLIIFGYVTNDAQYRDEEGIMIPGQWNVEGYIDRIMILGHLRRIFPNIAVKTDNDLKEHRIAKTDIEVMRKNNAFDYATWENEIVSDIYIDRYREETLMPLADALNKTGIPYCFVTTPNTPDYEHFNTLYAPVIPQYDMAGITFYDCLDDFVSKHAGDSDYYEGINPVNGHPGVAGNAYIADYTYDIIISCYADVFDMDNAVNSGSMPGFAEYNNINSINDRYPYSMEDTAFISDNVIQFTYCDSWDDDRYLYLPYFEKTIKLCFEMPIDLKGKKIIIKDEDDNDVNYLHIYPTYIGENRYDIVSDDMMTCTGGTYTCDYNAVTALNIGGRTDEATHIYRIIME